MPRWTVYLCRPEFAFSSGFCQEKSGFPSPFRPWRQVDVVFAASDRGNWKPRGKRKSFVGLLLWHHRLLNDCFMSAQLTLPLRRWHDGVWHKCGNEYSAESVSKWKYSYSTIAGTCVTRGNRLIGDDWRVTCKSKSFQSFHYVKWNVTCLSYQQWKQTQQLEGLFARQISMFIFSSSSFLARK